MPHAQRNLRLLYAFWFLRDFQLWIPVWIVFLTLEQGFSLTQVLTAEGLYLVGVILLEVPTGAVADRWGRSRSLALGALSLGASVLLFAYITNYAILLASFTLWSVGTTLMSGADTALLFEILKQSGREHEYERAAGRGVAVAWSGAGLATVLGGPVAAALDIRVTILIGAATCLLTASVALLIREPRHHAPGASAVPYLRTIRRAFRDAWGASDLRAVFLLSGVAFAALEGVGYLVQPYLVDRGVEVGVRFSLLQAPLFAAGVAGGLAVASLRGRVGAAPVLVVLPLIGAAAYAALAAAPGLSGYVMLLVLPALGACVVPFAGGYINRRVPSERRATVLSIQGLASSAVLAGLAPGYGYLAEHRGLSWSFAAGGALLLVAVLAFSGPLLLRRPALTGAA